MIFDPLPLRQALALDDEESLHGRPMRAEMNALPATLSTTSDPDKSELPSHRPQHRGVLGGPAIDPDTAWHHSHVTPKHRKAWLSPMKFLADLGHLGRLDPPKRTR